MTSSYAQALAFAALGALAAVTLAFVVGAMGMFASSSRWRRVAGRAAADLAQIADWYDSAHLTGFGESEWRTLARPERLRLALLIERYQRASWL